VIQSLHLLLEFVGRVFPTAESRLRSSHQKSLASLVDLGNLPKTQRHNSSIDMATLRRLGGSDFRD